MLKKGFFETLARARAGDEQAFALIYGDVQPALLRYSQAYTPGSAEDITAEVWLQVARMLHRFEGDEHRFRAWIFVITRNKIVDQIRSDTRRPTIPVEDADGIDLQDVRDPADDYEEEEATRRALELVRMLPRAQSEVILLRVIAGLDYTQIARLLGKTPGAVRVLSHRGLRRLAGILTEQTAVGSGGR